MAERILLRRCNASTKATVNSPGLACLMCKMWAILVVVVYNVYLYIYIYNVYNIVIYNVYDALVMCRIYIHRVLFLL